MLKSFDYIDPLLAKSIVGLESELSRIDVQREQILKNNRVNEGTRNKLITYLMECKNSTAKLLQGEKLKMTEYLDHQLKLVNNTNRSSQQSTRNSSYKSSHINQSTKIELNELDETKSYDLNTTRNLTKHKSFDSNHHNLMTVNKQEIQKCTKASKSRALIRQLKIKTNKQQKVINVLIAWLKIYAERQKKCIQNESDLQNLQKMNSQLQAKCDLLESELKRMRKEYGLKSRCLLEGHIKTQIIRDHNNLLRMERNDLLRQSKSGKRKH